MEQNYCDTCTRVGLWRRENSLSGFGVRCCQPGVLQLGRVCLRLNAAEENKAKRQTGERSKEHEQVQRMWFQPLHAAGPETRGPLAGLATAISLAVSFQVKPV